MGLLGLGDIAQDALFTWYLLKFEKNGKIIELRLLPFLILQKCCRKNLRNPNHPPRSQMSSIVPTNPRRKEKLAKEV